jgi:hypothetical protein
MQEEVSLMMLSAVPNMQSLEESLDNFFRVQEMTGSNQVLTGHQLIDARRMHLIRTVPPITILNLKRVRYQYNIQRQTKITSKVTFPLEIDIAKDLETPEPSVYQLSGAVIHSGGADSGHYRSILFIRDRFYLFNDRSVRTIRKSEMQPESFGDDNHYSSSAYLLFYVRKGGKIEGRDVFGNFKLNLQNDFTQLVDIANQEILAERCVFNPSVMEFVCKVARFSQLQDFYFSVFCYSCMGELARRFTTQMQTQLDPVAEKRQFMKWMADAGLKVSSVYANCTTSEIVQSLIAIVTGVVLSRDLTFAETKDVMEVHFHALETCQDDAVSRIYQMLLAYVRLSDDRINFTRPEVVALHSRRCHEEVRNSGSTSQSTSGRRHCGVDFSTR